MKNQETEKAIKEFRRWRENLFNGLKARKESLIELIDALSSNQQATSVVELSLNPLFRRNYNSLYKGIQEFFPYQTEDTEDEYLKQIKDLLKAVSLTIPLSQSRHFNLFAIDTTPYQRPYSPVLADKKFIHYPNPIKGNKPINIGHTYSVICALPDPTITGNKPWAVPLSGERVPSNDKAANVGNKQLKEIFESSSFSRQELSVLVADNFYSQRDFIGEQVNYKNLVTITRVRSNRVFYRQFIEKITTQKKSGHPRWYGDKFDLKDENTWTQPNEVTQCVFTTKTGRQLTTTISAWKQMLMRGNKNYKMNSYPFTLLQILITDEVNNAVWQPMWLIVIGSRREELSLIDCYQSYRQRYDIEHFFRFSKQKLLMTAYSTPDVRHEENWFKLTLLAYVNLWAARKLAVVLPRPWEQYLKTNELIKISPSLVQRDFERIISTLGTFASSPKRRGYSSGRIKGYKQVPRTRHQVIKKRQKNKLNK
ncbi:NF041680 family putative transposase [Gloeothece verrucosa]|nr:NF041680 family putative transposase [Gloeothece verrucosa]